MNGSEADHSTDRSFYLQNLNSTDRQIGFEHQPKRGTFKRTTRPTQISRATINDKCVIQLRFALSERCNAKKLENAQNSHERVNNNFR